MSAPFPECPQTDSEQRLLGPLHLEGIAQGGDAVAHAGGRVVFAQGGLPGETVTVRLTKVMKGYARGQVEEVLFPAPERAAPVCPLFGRCGGCHWQYIAYPAQLALKQSIVAEQCRHLGRIEAPAVTPTIGMAEPWAYRSMAELHVGPAGEIGYYAGHSHTVVPLKNCPLLVPALNALLPPLQRALAETPPGERPAQIALRFSWAEASSLVLLQGGTRRGAMALRDRLAGMAELAWQHGRALSVLAGRGFLHETMGNASLRVSATSFFQINVPQARRILETVLAMLDPQPSDHLLDAYAGVGALSLPLAEQVEQVTAIEAHQAAVADLHENVRRLAAESRVEVVAGLVEEVLPARAAQLQGPPLQFDLVLVDPPRRGCLPAALRAILKSHPRRIVYVSCHPGTLARDLRELHQGGYRLRQVQPVDLFPQTFHVESVALLEREEQPRATDPAALPPQSKDRP